MGAKALEFIETLNGVRGDICVVYGMRFQDLNSVLSNRLLSDKASIISSQLFLL